MRMAEEKKTEDMKEEVSEEVTEKEETEAQTTEQESDKQTDEGETKEETPEKKRFGKKKDIRKMMNSKRANLEFQAAETAAGRIRQLQKTHGKRKSQHVCGRRQRNCGKDTSHRR